tara:strand:+ start:14318 stop:14434 length:117 start_codon:yes stop_codon:yes gene_type:complete
MINDILLIMYFNFVPVATMVFGSWVFIELVKYEHKRRK